MKSFNPPKEIENAIRVLDADGSWPSFHDAEIYSTSIWSGDVRPDDDVWIGPEIETSIGILGPKGEMPFAILRIKFMDCDLIEYSSSGFGCSMIYDLTFSSEERGYLRDGVTPLSPYIHVVFSNGPEVDPLLTFRCMKVQATGRELPIGPPYT